MAALRPAFASVELGSYRRGMVPEVHYTRLNRHYRPAVEMARLVIGSTLLEFLHGEAVGASLLVDMNRVFETFVRTALRQELRLSESEWPEIPALGRSLHLAEDEQVRVNPGLSWWRGRRCMFVGRYPVCGRHRLRSRRQPSVRHLPHAGLLYRRRPALRAIGVCGGERSSRLYTASGTPGRP